MFKKTTRNFKFTLGLTLTNSKISDMIEYLKTILFYQSVSFFVLLLMKAFD